MPPPSPTGYPGCPSGPDAVGPGDGPMPIDSYTNTLGAYVSVNAENICYYQEWKLKCNGETAYHILGVDGTTVCIYESKQAGGITISTSNNTLSTDNTCGWDGYIVGTFYPTYKLLLII